MTEDEMNRFIDSLSFASPERGPSFDPRSLPSPRAYGTIPADSGMFVGGGGEREVSGEPRNVSVSPGLRAGPVSGGAMLATGRDMPTPSVGYRVGAELPEGFSVGYSRMHPMDAPSKYDQHMLSLARQILGGNVSGSVTEQDGKRGFGASVSHPLGRSGNAFVNAQRMPQGGHAIMGGMDMRFSRGGYAEGGDTEVQSTGQAVVSDGKVNWGESAADFARADAAMRAMRSAPEPAPMPEPRRAPAPYAAPRNVPLPPARPAYLDRPYEPEGPFGALDMSTAQDLKPRPSTPISMGYSDVSSPFDVSGPDAPRFGLPEGYSPVAPAPAQTYEPEGPYGALDLSAIQPTPETRPYDPEGPFGALDLSAFPPAPAQTYEPEGPYGALNMSAIKPEREPEPEPTTDELLSFLTNPEPQPANVPLPPPRPANLGAAPRASINLNPQQRDLIARTIAAETSGKTPEEAQAIGHVILNRVASGKYGKTPEQVLFAPKQFEPWSNPRGANYPMRHKPGTPKYESAMQALDAAMGNEDITGGAMSFWAPKAQAALGRPVPKWAKSRGLDIGDTRFHREDGGMVEEREHHADGEAVGDARSRYRATLDTLGAFEDQPPMDPSVMGENWANAVRRFQENPVRADEQVARPLELGVRDTLGGLIAGGDRNTYPGEIRRRAADALVGSTGLPGSGTLGFGLADLPMVTGAPLQMSDIAQSAREGDYLGAGLNAALPAAFYARKPIMDAGRRAVDLAREYAPQVGAAVGAGAALAPEDAEAAKAPKIVQQALQSVAARKNIPDEVSGLFDYSRLQEVPKVQQFDLPRNIPARGVPERVAGIVADPDVRSKMAEVISRGREMGGANWYNTDPLRDRFIEHLGTGTGDIAHRKFMDFVAATSPRSKVGENVRNASYYYGREMRGEGMPAVGDKNPQPYGHMAQRLHQMNAERVAGAGWDPLNNPKPASFVENLVGNQQPATIDTHAFRLPAILAQDPRFLETAYLASKDAPKLNIQKMVNSGEMTLEDALKTPAYWQAQPKANEYGAMERYYQDIGRELGLTPAQAQASAWVGGGKLTGLGSDESKPFLRFFDDRIMKTARERNMDPKDVLQEFITGQSPLYADGGSVVDRALMVLSKRAK